MPKKIYMLFICVLILSSLTFACNRRGGKTEKKTATSATSALKKDFVKENDEEYGNIKDTIAMPVYMPDLDLLADMYEPYLPALKRIDRDDKIIDRVTKIKETSINPAYYEVDYPKGLSVYGSSNPDFDTDADFTGEFDLGGKHFEEHSYRNNPESYQLLWRTSNATFMVSANLKDGLTKDDVKKIAGSLKPVP